MADGHGGARIGAGRNKKSLNEKILNGNPGKRRLEVFTFDDGAADLKGAGMPKPREYLSARQRDGEPTIAAEIYASTWSWLQESRCAELIPIEIIERYAQAVARWVQCEQAVTEFGFLAKHPTTGAAIPTPYVNMSQIYMKQANNLWLFIYQIVKENCSTPLQGKTPQDDVMERLLGG